MVKTPSTKSVLDIVSTFAIILASVTVLWRTWAPAAVSSQSEPTPIDVNGVTIEAGKLSNVLGAGPVAIVEFSDFECPFCGEYATDVWPQVKRELVDTKKVRYVSLQFPLERIHPLALKASEAAECAARQDNYWKMHDVLFQTRDLSRTGLARHAEVIGLNSDEFRLCLEQNETEPKVRRDLAEGSRIGVSGTPAFFIGNVEANGHLRLWRRINGIAALDVIRRETDAVRARQQRTSRGLVSLLRRSAGLDAGSP